MYLYVSLCISMYLYVSNMSIFVGSCSFMVFQFFYQQVSGSCPSRGLSPGGCSCGLAQGVDAGTPASKNCRIRFFESSAVQICPGWSGGTKITSNYLWVTPMYPMFSILALRDWNLKRIENPKSKAPWKRSRWTARVGTQAVSFSFHVSASACVSSKMKQMASTEYNCAVSPPSPPTLSHTAWSKHCGVATSAFDPPLPTKYVHQKFAVQEYLHKKLFQGKDVPFNDGNVWCASTRTQTKRNADLMCRVRHSLRLQKRAPHYSHYKFDTAMTAMLFLPNPCPRAPKETQ